jgi:hypothetical protein
MLFKSSPLQGSERQEKISSRLASRNNDFPDSLDLEVTTWWVIVKTYILPQCFLYYLWWILAVKKIYGLFYEMYQL